MLHIIIQPPFDETAKCAHFEIGESTKDINPELVQSVLVDGKELGFVLTKFDNLPKRRESTSPDMSWFGDDAKFIVANWT